MTHSYTALWRDDTSSCRTILFFWSMPVILGAGWQIGHMRLESMFFRIGTTPEPSGYWGSALWSGLSETVACSSSAVRSEGSSLGLPDREAVTHVSSL